MLKLSTEQLGQLLHKSRHEPRRLQKRYLKELSGEGSAEELDAVLAEALQDSAAIEEANRLDELRRHTLRGVEQGMVGQIAEMIACIRVEMDRQGLTQSQLAGRCNLTQPMLSDYLTGKRQPTLGNFAKLATALGCSWRLVPREDIS